MILLPSWENSKPNKKNSIIDKAPNSCLNSRKGIVWDSRNHWCQTFFTNSSYGKTRDSQIVYDYFEIGREYRRNRPHTLTQEPPVSSKLNDESELETMQSRANFPSVTREAGASLEVATAGLAWGLCYVERVLKIHLQLSCSNNLKF